MPERLTQAKRRRLLTRSLDHAVSQFGFRHHAGPYFSRQRNALVDAFFFQFSRSNFRFTLKFGVDAPDLLAELRHKSTLSFESEYPSLTISPRVIEQNDFGCKYEEHILNAADRVTALFSGTILPWLDRFKTSGDVIAEYHRLHIGTERPVETDAARNVLRWTVYGLMLYNNDQRRESVPWLEAALKQWLSLTQSTPNTKEWVRIITSTGVGT